mmetsp:Transcript_16304/g.25193  ORF Transcript_16304/g.25193 Transcript_16304/m.25193 type:complete len:131 (+) Transcript_16304:1416-1808(+)
MQEEWSSLVKPALNCPNLAFAQRTQALPKKLKRLIEANSLPEQLMFVSSERKASAISSLTSIQRFVQKIEEILVGNESHSNMCIKATKSGSLFGRMFEGVKFAAVYAAKKCSKEIDRVSQMNVQAADRYD